MAFSEGSVEFQYGNADDDTGDHAAGLLVGNALELASGLRQTSALEVRWGHYQAGESHTRRLQAAGHSLCVLLSGLYVVEFTNARVALFEPGHYVQWDAKEVYGWHAIADSTVVSFHVPRH